MPYQNRVTPFNELIAIPARGTFTGNRGCIHNTSGQIVRKWAVKRWITCLLEFKGWHREVMTPGLYTHLFFLDEATAFAAGHRPCAECRHAAFTNFKKLWLMSNPYFPECTQPSIDEIDNILHQERVGPDKKKVTYRERLEFLPDGTFITLDDGKAYLIYNHSLLEWSHQGYMTKKPKPAELKVNVLTPKSIVKTFEAGYRPQLHDSASR
ncbi:MAG TPA: hypothetical protein VH186_26915 [Chloroflexia bacterium]|nr:hypothetical protein [Chloroflexia bacterium]